MSIDFAITSNAVVFDPAAGTYGTDSVLHEYKISPSTKRALVIEGDPLIYDRHKKKMVSVLDGMGMRLSAAKLEFAGVAPKTFQISNALVPCISVGQCEIINNGPFLIQAGSHVTFVFPSLVSCADNERVKAFPLECSLARSYCRFVVDEGLDRKDPLLRQLSAESMRIHGNVLTLSDGDPIFVPVREDIDQRAREFSDREMEKCISFYSQQFRREVTKGDIELFDLFLDKRRRTTSIPHAIATTTALPLCPLKLLLLP